ncbi:MAG TPA: hypothetical protein VHB21_25015 [Minicystis sp.]|nr:hypothetical protein [Minicystis sp.]
MLDRSRLRHVYDSALFDEVLAAVTPSRRASCPRSSRTRPSSRGGPAAAPAGSLSPMRKLLPWLVSVAAGAACLASAGRAHAGEAALGAAVGVALPLESGLDAGVDVDGLLGYRLHAARVWLQPELVGGFRGFGRNVDIGRVGVGARLGFGRLIQPELYAHVGGAFGDASGFNFDGGGALDLKVSLLFVGVHAGVDILSTNAAGPVAGSTTQWLDLGLHAGLLL